MYIGGRFRGTLEKMQRETALRRMRVLNYRSGVEEINIAKELFSCNTRVKSEGWRTVICKKQKLDKMPKIRARLLLRENTKDYCMTAKLRDYICFILCIAVAQF